MQIIFNFLKGICRIIARERLTLRSFGDQNNHDFIVFDFNIVSFQSN